MESLPCVQLTTLLGNRRPLILAPHPDDESLGCGGLIAECCQAGRQPVVMVLTDGAASHPGSREYPPDRLRQVRTEEVREATRLLGLACENLLILDHPDTALCSDRSVWEPIVTAARQRGCSLVVAPWQWDPHCDHEAAAIIASAVAAALACPLLSYPVWGWLLPPDQDVPLARLTGWRFPIADHLEAKRGAIAAHASQYSDLIKDSPDGFRLPQTLLTVFDRPFEVFLAND
jgi:LmbE family N-acetylglucosaminyl deacetylase